jgi:hypothetical protein
MRFPLRRIVLGFAVGAGAGWVASLLRRPKDAPAGTGADAAEHFPPAVTAEPDEPEQVDHPEQPEPETEPEQADHPEQPEPARDEQPEPQQPEPAEDEPALEGADEIAQEPTAPPRKAVPAMVTPPAVRSEDPPEPEAAESEPAKPTRRARKRVDPAAVTESLSEAVREGRTAMNEHLAGLEQAATPPTADDARRRRRRP